MAGDSNPNLGTVSNPKDKKETNTTGFDETHPTAHLSKQNEENSWFITRFPWEIQRMILEFAMEDAMVIKPKQITPRSNKFVWNEDPRTFGWEYKWFQEKRLKSTKEPMMFTKLLRTCKYTYNILTDRDFYGLHTFAFNKEKQLHYFLAAVTPGRRKAIRHITLEIDADRRAWQNGWHYIMDIPLGTRFHNDIFALLCQCELDTFTLRLSCVSPEYSDPLGETQRILQKLSDQELPADVKVHSLWSLPGVRLVLTYDNHGAVPLYGKPWTIEEESSATNAQLAFPWLESTNISTLISLVRTKFDKLKPILKKKDEDGQGVRSTITQNDLARALGDSCLDFPGELRISQTIYSDEYGYAEGTIGNRTRSRARAAANNATGWGTVSEKRPVRNAEGRITREAEPDYWVKSIRWAEDSIWGMECEMETSESVGKGPYGTRWEDIEVLGTWWQFEVLIYHFKRIYKSKFISRLPIDEARQNLRELEEAPGPLDIQDPVLRLVEQHTEGDVGVKKKCFREKLEKAEVRRQRRMARLRKHIRKHDAREARKLAREAKEAAKAAREEKKRKRGGASASAASGDDDDQLGPEPKKVRRSTRNK
ncbi:hypothetical protein F5X99DRAFT_405024 [Biscogniauxia marginata]|nr:hypothetical protein F5X99DRAFT_405024 [Biscogniauxia marginata]